MSSLLSLLFGAIMVVLVAFWMLFLFVVKVRIADKGIRVEKGTRFGFLVTRWPHEEMRAYLASLGSQEKRNPINRFLRSAWLIIFSLFAAYVLVLTIVIFAGR